MPRLQARMLAPDGRCKTFDASANGYVRGARCNDIRWLLVGVGSQGMDPSVTRSRDFWIEDVEACLWLEA